MTSNDLGPIMKDQEDAEQYRHLKEKIKPIEDDSYLLDRLEACDTLVVFEVLRELASK